MKQRKDLARRPKRVYQLLVPKTAGGGPTPAEGPGKVRLGHIVGVIEEALVNFPEARLALVEALHTHISPNEQTRILP